MALKISFPANRGLFIVFLAFVTFNIPANACQASPREQSDSSGRTAASTYDSSGQLVFVTDGDGNKIDPAGNPIVASVSTEKSGPPSPSSLISPAAPAIIHVPADQSTIQAAINAASNGDTVLVADGTYKENINFKGKAITVTSVNGPATTIIDGGAANSVVTFITGEGANSILNGFTITNGNASEGGGILVSSSPAITNNVIHANQGCNGIGIGIGFGAPLIQGNTISNNSQSGCSGGIGGGGISVRGESSGTRIIGNVIANNSMTGSGIGGGGISLFAAGGPIIQNNIFTGNNGGIQGGGIAIANNASPQIVDNLFIHNTASSGGGLGWLVPMSTPGILLLNNTIADNTAMQGSGIFADGFDSTAVFQNNLIIGTPGIIAAFCGTFNSTVTPNFVSDDVFTTGATPYGGNCTDQTGTHGNISVDPLFTNPAVDDFHVQPGSPAINAGNSTAPIPLPAMDLEGNPRSMNGKVDIGAYEFTTTTTNVSSTLVIFGAQKIGATSPPQTVTIKNTGSVGLHMVPFSITGDFSETDNCHNSSGTSAGKSCDINISFTPTLPGTRIGTLTVTSNDAASPLTIHLSGNGPVLKFSIPSIDFGNQLVNSTSSTQSFTLFNIGDATLSLTSITASGDFSQTNNCNGSVVASGSCTVNVTLTPTSSGTRNGNVTVMDNAAGSPHMVTLQGNGTDFNLSPQQGGATTATVSAGSMATYNLSLSGTSGAIGNVSLSCNGAPAAANCLVNPASLTLNGTTPANFTVGVSTAARSAALPVTPRSIWTPPLGVGVFLWATLAALTTGALTRLCRRERRMRFAGLAATVFALLLLVGCGGSGGTPKTQQGTPAGTFTLTVTAVSGSATRTINLTLTVN
jgi:hypothetical protein